MNTKPLLAFLAALVLASAAHAQPITTQNTEKSAETNLKIAKLDLCLKILPLALSKDQYKDLLLQIGKARQKWRGQMEQEDAELATHAVEISDTLDAAINKGIYPSKEFQTKIADMNNNASLKEAILQAGLIDGFYDFVIKSFNAGQLKVMEGSFADTFIQPGAKPGDLKPDRKIKFYIQAVFMDPWAFDVVGSLAAATPAGPAKSGSGTGG